MYFSRMTIPDFIQLFAALGIGGVGGGIVGAYFQSRFQHQKEVQEDIHNLKRQRYGAILIQMLTILDPERGLIKIEKFRPDLKNIDDVKDEVKTEMLNSVLFASDEVIKAMAEFIQDPSYPSYIKSASAMRNDLWNRKTKVNEDILKVFSK